MRQEANPGSRWSLALALVALAAFLAGLAVGQLGAVREPGRSRADWPKPEPPHPRTLSP